MSGKCQEFYFGGLVGTLCGELSCVVYCAVDYVHSETSVTALMVAAGRGFFGTVEQLLNMGANVSAHSSNDWTALDWARQFDQHDVVELLETHMYDTCHFCT